MWEGRTRKVVAGDVWVAVRPESERIGLSATTELNRWQTIKCWMGRGDEIRSKTEEISNAKFAIKMGVNGYG